MSLYTLPRPLPRTAGLFLPAWARGVCLPHNQEKGLFFVHLTRQTGAEEPSEGSFKHRVSQIFSLCELDCSNNLELIS